MEYSIQSNTVIDSIGSEMGLFKQISDLKLCTDITEWDLESQSEV